MWWKGPVKYDDLVIPQGVRPYLRYATVAFALAAVSAVVLRGLYTRGPAEAKLVVAYFGGPAGLRQAMVIWWVFGGLTVVGLLIAHRWPLAALALVAAGAARHQLDPRLGLQALDFAVPIVLFLVATRAPAR